MYRSVAADGVNAQFDAIGGRVVMEAVSLFPAKCPACGERHGLPISATTRPQGGVRLEIRCSTCEHRWMEDMDTGDRDPKRDS